MALPLRPRFVPQCSACLRSYAFGRNAETQKSGLRQQVRGKKKMPNKSGSITVRLLKDVKAYGRRGALVPISPGAMRNMWFPRRVAEYVTIPELKRLRLNNVAMDRDFEFGVTSLAIERGLPPNANAEWQKDIPSDIKSMSNAELRDASALERAKIKTGLTDTEPKSASAPRRAVEVEKITPERSVELIELFVPPRLEFYRQPILEEREKVPEKPALESPQFGGAAGDLLAARTPSSSKRKEGPQGIYGSVSSHDILVAVRAVMADNEEAARVVLQEGDIHIVDLLGGDGAETGKVKHVGDFVVEIKVRGSDKPLQRTVRVSPQEV